jgi:hypothetical protein
MTSVFSGAVAQNDLVIPFIMGPTYLITRGIGFGLFALFFFAEALRLQLKAVEHAVAGGEKPEFNRFLLRAFFVFVSAAFLYKWIFLKMISLCDHMGMLLCDDKMWDQFIMELSRDGNVSTSLYSLTVPTAVGIVAMVILQYIQDVFLSIRFVILCMLFVVGPILWAFSISSLGLGAMRGWFKSTWQVSFWYVVFSIIKTALVSLGSYALSQAGGSGLDAAQQMAAALVVSIIYCIVIIYMIFMIPTLTASLFSDGNLAAVGQAAMGAIVSYGALRGAGARGQSVSTGVAGAVNAYKGAGGGVAGISAALSGLKPRPGGSDSPGSSGTADSDKDRTR